MHLKNTLKRIIQSDWFIAFIILGIFFLANSYKYGWDDQHLEIPLLKSLIDPQLYAGDYYVESLKKNFTSFFYPILARLISVEQIPSAYFFLYLISRYVLFLFMYKLWKDLSGRIFTGLMCMLVFLLMVRVDEFLYRTFSHQEFALAIIFPAIYYFFKDKFLRASILLGLAANFHALYSVFPTFYVGIYLLWTIKKNGWKALVKCSLAFLGCALPFLIWTFERYSHISTSLPGSVYQNWLSLYLIACPQNFFMIYVSPEVVFQSFDAFFHILQNYVSLVVLFILNISFNARFRENTKAKVFCLAAFGLLAICLVFTNIYPTKFFLDLNLVRNTQFLLFLLTGFTVILLIEAIENNKPFLSFCFGIFFSLLKLGELVFPISAGLMFGVFALRRGLPRKESTRAPSRIVLRIIFIGLGILNLLFWGWRLVHHFNSEAFRVITLVNITLAAFLLGALYFLEPWAGRKIPPRIFKKIYFILPLCLFFFQYTSYHFQQVRAEQNEEGYWRIQRNWEDMQYFVKAHTPKDALLLVPYDMEMGGFRIFSQRKIICCYRDCGIIGFDYNAAVEWQIRLHDIESYKVAMASSFNPAVQKAIYKYGADYIVFMRYAMPPNRDSLLELMYQNTDFSLYKIKPAVFSLPEG